MYEAYIVKINNLRKHHNADRLQIAEIFNSNVIVGLDVKLGDIGLFFPIDGRLGKEYAEINNLVRKKDAQGNEIGGYLDPEKRNIKAMKLRGERSEGLYMPLESLSKFTKIDKLKVGDKITTLNGTLICEKYIPRTNGRKNIRNGKTLKKKKKVVQYPLFKEHLDTEQLDYNLDQFKKGDTCYITLKMHGTSQRTANLPRERKGIFRLFKNKYGIVTGTRRVVLDAIEEKVSGGYYGNDGFRKQHHDYLKDKLKKGETVYYEVVGWVDENTPIMPSGDNKKIQDKEFTKLYGEKTNFTYGCEQGTSNIYVYRMTMTTEEGYVIEYPWELVKLRCEEMGINSVPELDKFIFTNKKSLMHKVEKYLDITDPIGKTHISEGVVVRIDNRKIFKAYKKKGFYFKCLEGLIKENADAPDMEESQEV